MSAIFAFLAVAVLSSTVTAARVETIVAGGDRLPSLARAQIDAAAAAGFDADIGSWAGRSRWRGLLPRLDVRVGTDNDLDIRDSFSRSYSRTTTEGQTIGFEVAARWALGDLVFADAELRANRQQLAAAAARRLLADAVTRLYFDRVELLLRSETSASATVRAARLDGRLHALTNGTWRVRAAPPPRVVEAARPATGASPATRPNN